MISAASASSPSSQVGQPTLVSSRRPGVSPAHQQECEGIMSASVRDYAKMKARVELLAAHPGRKATIDTCALKGIAGFDEFLCHSECSVARGEAVAGSDIDMALIVSRSPIGLNQQVALARELRSQGFVGYHSSELSHRDPAYPEKMLQVIKFKTHDELRDLYQGSGVLHLEVQCYVAGYRIDSDSDRPACSNRSSSFGFEEDIFGSSNRFGRRRHDFGGRDSFDEFSGRFGSEY